MRVTVPQLPVGRVIGQASERIRRSTRAAAPPDRTIWVAAMGLMALGTVMVLSSSVMLAERRYGTPGFFWWRQLLWWALAIVSLYVFSRIEYRRWQRLAPLVMIGSFVSLIVVLLVPAIKGVHRWIPIGPFNLQPSELFRVALIVYSAAYLAKRGDEVVRLKRWLPLIGVVLAGSGLVLAQPELSTVMTVCATVGIMLIAAGIRWRHVLPVIALGIAGVCVVVFGYGYKTQRVVDWKDGLSVTGGSYQIRQSKIAIGSGGMIGEGLGHGNAKMLYLPEPHTDFIIASVGEELGFIGFSAVLLGLGVLVLRAWRVAARAPDMFGYLLCIGIGAALFINAGLNLGVATGILPATGLPLPFVSYGGSSLLTTAAAWGMVLNVSRFQSAGGWR